MTDKSPIGQDIPEAVHEILPAAAPGPRVPPRAVPSVAARWDHDFRLFFTARTVAPFGDGMVAVALAVGLLGAGRPASSVGHALGAWMGPIAAFVLLAVPGISRLRRIRSESWPDPCEG
ncbi:hypothetical protein ACIOUE_29645 [Streptomyces xanthochromogenes]|uniref:hypothetical protein n=1 Tax=Streptomyces xanthochromogenes TaxID=67384 RepID=UPI00382395BC